MKCVLYIFMILSSIESYGQGRSIGCNANINSRPSENFEMFNNSGNIKLDNFFSSEIKELRRFFNVDPTVVLYQDEADAPNAQAMPTIENSIHPSGTVIFGLNMIRQEFSTSSSGTTIPLILAHEFAHIMDFKNHITDNHETKITELFADFEAGCFLYYRSIRIYTDSKAIVLSFYSKGDYGFNNPDHHGTPQERTNALIAGYNWLRSKAQPGVYVSIDEAISAGKNYLSINGIDHTSQEHSSQSSATGTLKSHISLLTTFLSPISDGTTTTYKYSVKVSNRNDVPVRVLIGGLSYGHYVSCKATSINYVRDGDFDDQKVSIEANSTDNIEIAIDINENPSNFCSGVKPNQKAKVLSVEKD